MFQHWFPEGSGLSSSHDVSLGVQDSSGSKDYEVLEA